METLTQHYKEVKIRDIAKQDVVNLIKYKLSELITDYGQKVDIEDLTYLTKRTHQIISAKYQYFTWGDIETALDRGKVGQYKTSVNPSRVTVQKIESWLFAFSEERSRNRVALHKNVIPEFDRSKQAPPEYGEALSWKIKNLSGYPDLWAQYPIKRIIQHIQAGTMKYLTENVNIQKEGYERKENIFTQRSRKRSYQAS